MKIQKSKVTKVLSAKKKETYSLPKGLKKKLVYFTEDGDYGWAYQEAQDEWSEELNPNKEETLYNKFYGKMKKKLSATLPLLKKEIKNIALFDARSAEKLSKQFQEVIVDAKRVSTVEEAINQLDDLVQDILTLEKKNIHNLGFEALDSAVGKLFDKYNGKPVDDKIKKKIIKQFTDLVNKHFT